MYKFHICIINFKFFLYFIHKIFDIFYENFIFLIILYKFYKRIMYNSRGAHSTINHLHYHINYMNEFHKEMK